MVGQSFPGDGPAAANADPAPLRRAYIIRDSSVQHLDDTLEELRNHPPDGWCVEVAMFDEDISQGRIFEEVVRKKLEAAHLVVALTDEPNANVAFELGYVRGLALQSTDDRHFVLATSRSQPPAWLENEPPYMGLGICRAADLTALETLLRQARGARYEERPRSGEATLFLCPPNGLGEPYSRAAAREVPHWQRYSGGTWTLADMHRQLDGIGRVVWVICPRDDQQDPRDGPGNTACAALAGFARALDIETVTLRATAARNVADVASKATVFDGSDGLRQHLKTLAAPPLPNAATPGAEIDPLDAYWRYARARCARLVSLYPTHAEDLDKVCVELALAPGLAGTRTVSLRQLLALAPEDESPEVSEGAEDLLGLGRLRGRRVTGQWVLLGDPGAGKSTAAKHLVVALADLRAKVRAGEALDAEQQALFQDGEPPVALFLSLPALATAPSPLPAPTSHVAAQVANADGDAAARGLADRLQSLGQKDGRLWVLLDGYDELDRDQRSALRNHLPSWRESLPGARLLVTSRRTGYEPVGAPFREASVEPLDRARQDDLLVRWLGTVRAREVRHQIDAHPTLAEVAQNPLLLSLLAKLEDERLSGPQAAASAPPSTLDAVYDRAVQHLLTRGHGEQPRPVKSPAYARELLGALSLALQGEERESWSRTQLDEALRALLRPDSIPPDAADRTLRERRQRRLTELLADGWQNADGFFSDLDQNGGLMGQLDGSAQPWRFLHRSLREFLAAEELARLGPEHCSAHGPALADPARWAEVFGLLLGRLGRGDGNRADAAELKAARERVLADLCTNAPSLALRALPAVEGLSMEEGLAWLERPRDPRSWQEILEQSRGERLQWDGDHLVRLIAGWRRGGIRDESIRAFLLSEAKPERQTEELAFFLYGLEHSGQRVDREEFFGRCGRWPEQGSPALPDAVRIPVDDSDSVRFRMGSPNGVGHSDEQPQREVTLRPYRMAVTAVTESEYVRFDPRRRASHPKRPVVGVSWWEAWLYARWLGGRLPTEAEWECAARAGTQTLWSHGDDEASLSEYAWYQTNAKDGVHDVGTRRPNPWGLGDVHGNVAEWCEDWYEDYDPARGVDSAGPAEGHGRVLRGGSFNVAARWCRSAFRGWSWPWNRHGDVGFRVVLPCSRP
ncbi:MAG: SUMF1/EgtB/PvdO family nonheme iron enzyme [Planctomycetaceae bacterium]|nr:SUMF1/EgtB/PvdO family nonheme iron enzyme [Planctomycetaceae bacterium]